MPRRRTRADQPVEEELPAEPAVQAPEEQSDDAMDIADGDQKSLQFDEELSWRPAKPIPSATLLVRLEKLSKELADFDQGEVVQDSLSKVAADLAHRNLLQHKDRGVKAYTACCLVDLLRLYAPEAPFTEEELKVKLLESMYILEILIIGIDDVFLVRQRHTPSAARPYEPLQ